MHKTLKNKVAIQYRTGGQVGQDSVGGQGRAARWVKKAQSRVECTAWSKQQESHRSSHPWTHTHTPNDRRSDKVKDAWLPKHGDQQRDRPEAR